LSGSTVQRLSLFDSNATDEGFGRFRLTVPAGRHMIRGVRREPAGLPADTPAAAGPAAAEAATKGVVPDREDADREAGRAVVVTVVRLEREQLPGSAGWD